MPSVQFNQNFNDQQKLDSENSKTKSSLFSHQKYEYLDQIKFFDKAVKVTPNVKNLLERYIETINQVKKNRNLR